ncbi:MAG: group II intron reverse transcriptase/maturase [bacterium]|nr:group II intron reverse transcriptase/maturase [bacterium]
MRGGKWHTLIDKVFDKRNLYASARKVLGKKGAAGVDHQSVEDFSEDTLAELDRLHEQLRGDLYRPLAVRRTWIPKPGSKEKRPLGIPTVRDRVIQTALVHVIEPIFDHTFHKHSYGFRRGCGCHQALARVEELLAAGDVFVVDADLKSYFDTIPKDRLMEMVASKVSDRRILKLIEMYLKQEIMEDLKSWTPEAGVPQGAVLSPLLSNVYLNPLDHHMNDSGFEMVRYADDFVVLCRTADEAEQALDAIRQWVSSVGLTLHPEKTHIVDSRSESFDFLGYSFRGKLRFPRGKSNAKERDAIRSMTPRKSGQSLDATIQCRNRNLRGWHAYFRHCHWSIFREYDQLIRRRLRRLLLKRHRRNRKRLPAQQRWPNKYFHERGLYSLSAAHARFVQTTGTY